jgi:hypothetical protein
MKRNFKGSARGLIATGVAVVALGGSAAVSLSGFSAAVANTSNTFSAGTMQLEESQGVTNCYSTGTGTGGTVTAANSGTCATINDLVGTIDQVPAGTPLTTTITMKNVGTVPASVESLVFGACSAATASDANGYVGSDTSGFCAKVDFNIGYGTKCLYPANAAAACPATPLNTGTLAGVATTTINQASTPPMPVLAAGASQAYTITVMLDTTATNIDQGLAASVPMTWNQS